MERRYRRWAFFLILFNIAAVILYVANMVLGDKAGFGALLSYYPLILLFVAALFLVDLLSNKSPELPVQGVIYAWQYYEQSRRFEAMRPFLSKEFLKDPRVLLALQWKADKVRNITTEITKEANKMRVQVIFKNDVILVFTVVHRKKDIDPAGSSVWVVDDIEGL